MGLGGFLSFFLGVHMVIKEPKTGLGEVTHAFNPSAEEEVQRTQM